MAAYGAATSQLSELAGGDAARVDEALQAASQEIDDAFAGAGYLTPLDTSGLGADPKARLDAMLAVTCRQLAAWALSSKATKKGASDSVRLGQDDARRWLERVAERQVIFPGLPRGAAAVGLAVVEAPTDRFATLVDTSGVLP